MEALVRLSSWMARRRRAAITAGAALALACLPFAVLLYANLSPAVEDLLPRNAPSIAAIDELHRRLGDNLQLSLLVGGAPVERLHIFADRVAARAMALPKGAPRFVDYRPKELQDFFGERKLLFVDVGDLQELERRLESRLAFEKRRANPFLLDEGDEAPRFDDILDRYAGKLGDLHLQPSGYYDGADGQSLAMIFYAGEGMTGYEASLGFRDGIATLGEEVARELGLSGIRLEFGGDIQSVIQEQRSLQEDVLTSTLIVLLLEGLLLFAFYRWLPSLLALGLPLAVGTLATFAFSYAAIGSLNASTAFLGSIIIGNGINPGIILLSRYVEERRSGSAPQAAMTAAVRGTMLPTLLASSAAAISYASLMVTAFRGYSQFGLMGGAGMVLCWITTYLLVPPVAVAADARWPLPARRGGSQAIEGLFGAIARVSVRRTRTVAAVSAAITLVTGLGIARLARAPIDPDTTKLRSREAFAPGGAITVSRQIDAILQRFLTPVVALVPRDEDVAPVARAYSDALAAPGEHIIGQVMTLQSLVPDRQGEKLEIIRRLRARLAPAVLARLDASTRELVGKWMPSPTLAPFASSDLPEAVRRQFREIDGSEGRLVLLFPKFGSKTTDGDVVRQLAREVRSVPLPQGTALAGSYLVFADMFDSIGHDGPLATLAAFIAVLLLTIGLARGGKGAFAVTLSLLAGVAWTVGAAALVGMRFNFLNFIAMPITFGIGVDYATNVYGRYRAEEGGPAGLVRAVSRTGGAVAVCSATTVIGYSSLLLSRNGALFSFGALAVLGELACLAAALFLLPAVLGWRRGPSAVATAEEALDVLASAVEEGAGDAGQARRRATGA